MSNVDDVLDAFKEMTLTEVTDFVRRFEEEFGVSAAPAEPYIIRDEVPPLPEVEEQTQFDVILEGAGEKKIQVIKVVRELTKLGLKEAKDMVDGAPNPVVQMVGRDVADAARDRLLAAGAVVSVR
jgi:large subunit ribosomal protein L7/L12